MNQRGKKRKGKKRRGGVFTHTTGGKERGFINSKSGRHREKKKKKEGQLLLPIRKGKRPLVVMSSQEGEASGGRSRKRKKGKQAAFSGKIPAASRW